MSTKHNHHLLQTICQNNRKSDKLKTGKFVVVKTCLNLCWCSTEMLHPQHDTLIYSSTKHTQSRKGGASPFTLILSVKAAGLNVSSAILHHIVILLRFRKCNKWKQTEVASCRLPNFGISFLNIENPFLRPSHRLEDKEGHLIKDLASISTPATSYTNH